MPFASHELMSIGGPGPASVLFSAIGLATTWLAKIVGLICSRRREEYEKGFWANGQDRKDEETARS